MSGRQLTHDIDNRYEVLKLKEFACRIVACDNTVRNWIKNGILKEGEDFFRAGRDYRFPWSREHLERLMKRLAPVPPLKRPRMVTTRQNRTRLKFRA
jgi:hypothetical protein